MTNICFQLRTALSQSGSNHAEKDTVDVLVTSAEEYVKRLDTSQLEPLEDELQSIHDASVQSPWQTELFLALLHALSLPTLSIITRWFDLVLRPALRDPKLSKYGVKYAKDLVVYAIQGSDDIVGVLRRRLLDLYLLDALNESSGEDALYWAQMPPQERVLTIRWKSNLEEILLLGFGTKCPQEFMSVVNECFATPSSRLQLLMLLNGYASLPEFETLAADVLAIHPLMSSLLTSLQLDNSSTVCTMGLTVLVRLSSIFAVTACEELKGMLPRLLAILARITSWKERRGPNDSRRQGSTEDEVLEPTTEFGDLNTISVNPDLEWERLELTFDATESSTPDPRQYFTTLYYLFPCNVLRFLRAPATYLSTENPFTSPYTVGWQDALDEELIRSKSEHVLRGHMCHPLLIYRDAEAELAQPDFWALYNVSRIVSESAMLDVRNATLGQRERLGVFDNASDNAFDHDPRSQSDDGSTSTAPTVARHSHLSKPRISLQDMIATSVALKTNLDVEIVKPTSAWSSSLFPPATISPTASTTPLPTSTSSNSDVEGLPPHVGHAISSLQREVLLLRNEMNFELWLSRENMKHIGRLYENRVVSKNAEIQQQGLYNKLRMSKSQVSTLQRELSEQKRQAQENKIKFTDWNQELLSKQKELRAEQKNRSAEMAQLRDDKKQADARFVAQGRLLIQANKEVFDLQAERKGNQHKIDRLKDYEAQIDQHLKMQRLWDADFATFNERADDMQLIVEEYEKLKLRLESVEQSCSQMEETSRSDRRQVKTLQARLSTVQSNSARWQQVEDQIAVLSVENRDFKRANKKLREERDDNQTQVDELLEALRYNTSL